MINKILNHQELLQKPPVLVDVGASGELHAEWKDIAKYSICIGFDGDERETDFREESGGEFKKLYVFNKIVAEEKGQTDFYLTNSPFCSSRVEPNMIELDNWAFGGLFPVDKKITTEATTINDILSQLKLDYIDWFKTDSQGTDMRIFTAIDQPIIDKMVVAEFEPGIINAYKQEDLLYSIIEYMSMKKFWMSDMDVKGSQRISQKNFLKYFSKYKDELHKFNYLIKPSSCWAEVSFINNFTEQPSLNKRDVLLGCALGLVKKQYGFVIDISEKGSELFDDKIFKEILNYTVSLVKRREQTLFFKRVKKRLLDYV